MEIEGTVEYGKSPQLISLRGMIDKSGWKIRANSERDSRSGDR